MITNYKINQPFTSNFSVEEGEENSSRTWNHGAGRIVNHVETFFSAEARKVSGRKTIQSQHCESQLVTDFFLVLFKEIIRDKVFKLANEALNPSLKDLARQGLISFTKHKRPISSEDLEVLYAANQLGLNPPESFANSAWFNTILYFGKRGRENQREMKPGALQLNNNNNKPADWSTSSQARKRRKSVHLQVLQILHILCLTVVNSETETHFFLVQFLNSPSEYLNQKRQVFEFLIQGALRELISDASLSNLVQSQWKSLALRWTSIPSMGSRNTPGAGSWKEE